MAKTLDDIAIDLPSDIAKESEPKAIENKLSELSTKVGEFEGVIGTPKEGAEYTTIFGAIEQLIGSLQDDWRATDAEAEAYFNS